MSLIGFAQITVCCFTIGQNFSGQRVWVLSTYVTVMLQQRKLWYLAAVSKVWMETSHTEIFSSRLCQDICVEIITQERHVLFKQQQCSLASLYYLQTYITFNMGHSPCKTSRLGMQCVPSVTVFNPAIAELITPGIFFNVSIQPLKLQL
jgi:hypothetical protein